MADQNQQNQIEEERKTGKVIYFIGIIIVAVIGVGYLLFKTQGLL